MRALARRVTALEDAGRSHQAPERLIIFGLDPQHANDEERKAMDVVLAAMEEAFLAHAAEAAVPAATVVAKGSAELRDAVALLTLRGAVFPPSVIVEAPCDR